MTQRPTISFEKFLDDWNLESLHRPASIQPPSPPQFPAFMQLVELDREQAQAPPARSSGLFEGLLGGRPEALYEDAMANPDKYSPEAQLLLADIVAGKVDPRLLSDEQRRLLDLATIDFATAKPKAPRRSPKAAPRPAAPPAAPLERPTPGVDVPGEVPEPYWWLK
jgi:hypothetical protein